MYDLHPMRPLFFFFSPSCLYLHLGSPSALGEKEKLA